MSWIHVLAGIAALAIFVYLIVALWRPEDFS